MVKEVFSVKLGKITKSDIMEMCPNLSRSAVEKALRELVAENILLNMAMVLQHFILCFKKCQTKSYNDIEMFCIKLYRTEFIRLN